MSADPELEKWSRVPLVELVSDEEAKAICDIINGEQDSINRVRKLSTYLQTLREKLEAKGVLPEFLAYAVEYNTQRELGKKFGSGQGDN